MADKGVPKFRNDVGVNRIEIGAREFECTGATAPYDHPHIFLDMGKESEIVCPYCSTLYVYKEGLGQYEASPGECAYAPGETV